VFGEQRKALGRQGLQQFGKEVLWEILSGRRMFDVHREESDA